MPASYRFPSCAWPSSTDRWRSAARGIGEVIVAKQRNGPTGDVKLAWFDKFTRFENLEQRQYDDFD